MYRIIKNLNGFMCEVMIQDGTERHLARTLKEAVEWVKGTAKVMNHDKISKKDIEFLQTESQVVTRTVPWKPKRT